ncbi:MAG: hypothetical protein HC869_04755 [Rhodospirillales bacterium]|nr:hypothetical protein [Rhodospirillales bacterium]
MHVIIIARDAPGRAGIRADVHARHRAHLDSADEAPLRLCVSGPTLGPDGQPDGSMLIFEAEDLGIVRAFVERDPMTDVWSSFALYPFDWKRGRPT